MKKNLILLLVLSLMMISLVSSSTQVLGTFEKEKDIILVQTCASCTYNTITSITLPNSTALITNINMTKDGSRYTYTLKAGNITSMGTYLVNGVGNLNGVDTVWSYTFEVTGTGQELTNAKAIVYIGFFALLVFLFVLSIFGIQKLPAKSFENADGLYIDVAAVNYGKFSLVGLAWGLLIAINFTASNIALAYLGTEMMGKFFFALFTIQMVLSVPAIILYGLWLILMIRTDKKIRNRIEGGLPVDGI